MVCLSDKTTVSSNIWCKKDETRQNTKVFLVLIFIFCTRRVMAEKGRQSQQAMLLSDKHTVLVT